MKKARPYEPFDHPSDIGLRARGESLEELFENAAQGMIELMVNPAHVEDRGARPIEAEGDDTEGLLVAWLSEILYAFDAERFAPACAEVLSLGDGSVRGRLRGEELSSARHEFRSMIKAVTWHNLKVEKTPAGYQVSIVFDV